MIPFRALTDEESRAIRDDSLAHAQDDYFKAEAEADAALHEVAEFAGHARFWRKGDVVKFAKLTLLASDKESARRQARNRLLWEFCASVRAELGEPSERKEPT